MELSRYQESYALEITGCEKRIHDWSNEEGEIGSGWSSSLDYVHASFNFTKDIINSKELSTCILEYLYSALCIDLQESDISISQDGYIDLSFIEDDECNIIKDTEYSKKMFICDYCISLTLNGIDIAFEDLQEIFPNAQY